MALFNQEFLGHLLKGVSRGLSMGYKAKITKELEEADIAEENRKNERAKILKQIERQQKLSDLKRRRELESDKELRKVYITTEKEAVTARKKKEAQMLDPEYLYNLWLMNKYNPPKGSRILKVFESKFNKAIGEKEKKDIPTEEEELPKYLQRDQLYKEYRGKESSYKDNPEYTPFKDYEKKAIDKYKLATDKVNYNFPIPSIEPEKEIPKLGSSLDVYNYMATKQQPSQITPEQEQGLSDDLFYKDIQQFEDKSAFEPAVPKEIELSEYFDPNVLSKQDMEEYDLLRKWKMNTITEEELERLIQIMFSGEM